MKINKQKLVQVIVGTCAVVLSPLISLADATTPAAGNFSIVNPLTNVNTVSDLVGKFVDMFSYIAIIIAVLAFIWVGFQFILAQGKPEKLKELKGWLLWIVIGVAVIIGARIMVNIIISTLSASGVVNQSTLQGLNSAAK